jgi:hypothetical protein
VKQLAIALCVIQILAAIAMLIAAIVEIETILFVGPILSVIGLLHGFITRGFRSWSTLLFALSAPLVCGLIAMLIAACRWNPTEAHDPVVTITSVYLIFTAPLAALVLRRTRRLDTLPLSLTPAPWQFSLRSLLVLMTVVCILMVAGKILIDAMLQGDRLIFSGFALLVVALSGVVLWLFIAHQKIAPGESPGAKW